MIAVARAIRYRFHCNQVFDTRNANRNAEDLYFQASFKKSVEGIHPWQSLQDVNRTFGSENGYKGTTKCETV